MASNINANNIDGTYPVAGVDNDSQGFRTNFTNIKNNFTYAKAEITDLQSKAIVKQALTGGVVDNNMGGNLISSAEIKDFRETAYDLASVTGAVTLNHANGHWQKATMIGSISLVFSNLPAPGKLARIRFKVYVDNTTHTITLPTSVSLGTTGIAGYYNHIITFTEIGTYVFEFTTDDQGNTIHISDLSRPRDYFHSKQIRLAPRTFGSLASEVGVAGDVAGMLAVDTAYPGIWVCKSAYDGSTKVWEHVELESYGNEVYTTASASTASGTLATITPATGSALSFTADAATTYRFESYIPFSHSAGSAATHSFAVAFSGGTCTYTVEQQTSQTSVMTIKTATTTATACAATTAESSNVRMCRVFGTWIPAAVGNTFAIQYSTSSGTLTVPAGAWMRMNRK